jgi:hypothetical protein
MKSFRPADFTAGAKADPDETDGRKLYRALADSFARAQVATAARRVKMMTDQPKPPPSRRRKCTTSRE